MSEQGREQQTDLLVERDGAACNVILNRPGALNALTIEMKSTLADALPKLVRDAEIYALIIKSNAARAFCAGGDVKELLDLATADMTTAQSALADEYRLNWLLECFFKPAVALINGPVMGSGVGLCQYGTHLVAGENYRFAMPETAIGFFPDVGMAQRLSRLPNAVGVYLALTGRTIGRADAYALQLVTHCISSDHFYEIEKELADAQPIDPVLDSRHNDPGEAELQAFRPIIEAVFSQTSLADILRELEVWSARGSDKEQAWCRELQHDLAKNSPLAMHVTFQHLQQSAKRDLRETLMMDYHLACRFLESNDFSEGVRAMLIDKTRDPKWLHEGIEKVTESDVKAFFKKGDEQVFQLPTKEQVEFN